LGFPLKPDPRWREARDLAEPSGDLAHHCDNGFFGTTTPTFTEKSYGHFVVAYGYDEDGVCVADSTEPTSSFSYKYIPRSAFEGGFIRQGATAVNIPNWQLIGLTSPNAVKRFVLTRLVALYTQVLKGR
jgi:hypothetical protein